MPTVDKIDSLNAAGYREITFKNYNELIGGVRYVAIGNVDTGLNETETVAIQLLPFGDTCSWSIYQWSYECTEYLGSSVRSRIGKQISDALADKKFWYAKISNYSDINLGIKYPETRSRHTFQLFIESISGGQPWNFGTTRNFNERHPIDPQSRMAVDLRRQKEELDAREAKIKQIEAFAEADELKAIGAQFFANGKQWEGQQYFKAADDLRRRIQTLFLDQGKPVERLYPVVDITQYGGVYGAYPPPPKYVPLVPPKPEYEPPVIGGLRAITFDEEED